jgi:Winged helix DNA-binding domain
MAVMGVEKLTFRALNRATLGRQMLLARDERSLVDAVEHLLGLQAQLPMNPYVALWSRLQAFDPDALGQLVMDRRLVRIPLMRSTIHLVSGDDCLILRPLVQPVLDKELARHPEFGPALVGVDLAPVLAFARTLLADRPVNGTELRAAMGERFPDLDAAALAYACRNHLALVQVPPRGVWGRTAQVRSTTAESFLGRETVAHPSIDGVVRRYLGAFGPATVADVAAWSRLTGMREVIERLRPGLRTFRDEDGRELFDLLDAPIADPDTPAPPRFLPEYDNLWLSYADRGRLVPRGPAAPPGPTSIPLHASPWRGAVLIEGTLRAMWWLDLDASSGDATVVVDHAGSMSKRTAASVTAEGRRLLRLIAPDAAAHDVRLVPAE